MLCDNKEVVEQLKGNAQAYILSKYNWQDVAEETSDLYQKVLKK